MLGKTGKCKKVADEFGIQRWTDDIATAIQDPEIDTVIVGLPNYLHKKAVLLAAEAGKAMLCTKPLAISGPESLDADRFRAVHRCGQGNYVAENAGLKDYDEGHFLIKEEKMPDGKLKVILKDKQTGKIS